MEGEFIFVEFKLNKLFLKIIKKIKFFKIKKFDFHEITKPIINKYI